MQYILSEEEMAAFRKAERDAKESPSPKDLQAFCTYVADNLILTQGWMKGKAWGCIKTRKEEWYCDDCPSLKICPYKYKSFSQ